MEYFNISNRRYLGNKYKLLDWIKTTVDENCTDVRSFFDVFSGTGSVAFAFLDKRLASHRITEKPTIKTSTICLK